jgi:hypothetical protein
VVERAPFYPIRMERLYIYIIFGDPTLPGLPICQMDIKHESGQEKRKKRGKKDEALKIPMGSSPLMIQLDQVNSESCVNVVLEAESHSPIEGRSSKEQANVCLEADDAVEKITETPKLASDVDFTSRPTHASDPVLWMEVNADLRSYFADINPSQNIDDADFSMSGRKFGEKKKYVNKGLFYRHEMSRLSRETCSFTDL